MKRVVKFRGKVKYNGHYLFAGDWVYGDLIQTKFGCYISQTDFVPALSIPADKFIEVIPDTVGQFTGLVDKNGREVFEGDVIKCDIVQLSGNICNIGYIGYKDYGFRLNHKSTMKWPLSSPLSTYHLFEVIGTIHDTKL